MTKFSYFFFIISALGNIISLFFYQKIYFQNICYQNELAALKKEFIEFKMQQSAVALTQNQKSELLLDGLDYSYYISILINGALFIGFILLLSRSDRVLEAFEKFRLENAQDLNDAIMENTSGFALRVFNIQRTLESQSDAIHQINVNIEAAAALLSRLVSGGSGG